MRVILIYRLSYPSLSGGAYYNTSSVTTNVAENGLDRARVLCNYDARDPSELSVVQDEVTKFTLWFSVRRSMFGDKMPARDMNLLVGLSRSVY